MQEISKEQAEKIISKRQLINKIIGQLLWLPIVGLGWLLYKILQEIWPYFASKVLPELSRELLIEWIVVLYLICLFLLSLCILLSLRLYQKPIRETKDYRENKYFKM
jgi:hypothetical protein